MSITKIKWLSSKRDIWLAQRNELMGEGNPSLCRIGSSEVASVLGIGYGSAYVLFQKKVGLNYFQKKSYKMSMGQRMEKDIAESLESYSPDKEEFESNFEDGIKLRKLTKARYFLVNPEHNHLIASLDYTMSKKYPDVFTGEVLPTDVVVECKNPAFQGYRSWGGTPPSYYNVQVQQQLLVSGLSKAYLAVIAGSDWFDVFEILPDPELQAYISHKCEEFVLGVLKAKTVLSLINEEQSKPNPDVSFVEDCWGIINSLCPEPDGTADLQEFLEDDLYPETNTLEMQGDEQDLNHIQRYLKATSLEGKLKEYKRMLRNSLTLKMEDFEVLKVGDNRVINRRQPDKKPYFSIK